MKPTAGGYRVAVIGASSLLGKELLNILGSASSRSLAWSPSMTTKMSKASLWSI